MAHRSPLVAPRLSPKGLAGQRHWTERRARYSTCLIREISFQSYEKIRRRFVIKVLIGLLVLVSLKSSGAPLASDTCESAADPGPNQRLPIWGDEFNESGAPNMVFWTTGEGINTSNHEDEYYTARPENVRVENGHLVLEARHEDYMGEHYTSGILRSNAQWTYGRFEMCARLPQGRGTWPAFWMLPIAQNYGTKYWPDNGEIDIMELVGFKPYEIFGSTHTLVTNETGHAFAGTANTKFHLYAAEWAPDHVDYYVDHDFYFRVSRFGADWHSWPFDKDFYLLLNLAIGGDWGGAQGVDDSIFPVQYVIDFIRVFAP